MAASNVIEKTKAPYKSKSTMARRGREIESEVVHVSVDVFKKIMLVNGALWASKEPGKRTRSTHDDSSSDNCISKPVSNRRRVTILPGEQRAHIVREEDLVRASEQAPAHSIFGAAKPYNSPVT